MTAMDRPTGVWTAEPPAPKNYLNHEKGLWSWLTTLDHKRIGIMYLIVVMASYVLGGVFAVLLRTELIDQGPTFFSERAQAWDFYNHMFTLHGAVMTFMFIIPAIPAIIGNFVLPMMLGAKDVAFPRLNLLSWYCWMGGGIFFAFILIKGVVNAAFPGMAEVWGPGGLDTGWVFYTPYSTETHTAVVEATLGAFILGFSSILTAVNFIATIHKLRPRNMGWFRMPLLLWSLYSTAIIQILATPVLAITLLLLLAERTLGIGIFDPGLGGDPVLYQHFFWFYSHPAVYIMILPAMGVVSELISVFSRKHIFGYHFIALSSLAIALLGFLVWGHHMFTSGQSPMANAIFSLLTFSVAVPSAIKVFNWIATMYKGDIHLGAPMLYAMGTIFLFIVGGLTGLFLGALATDIHLHDTYFVVAHFHYVMMGSVLFALLGALYYWWPKMFGRMFDQKFAIVAFIVVFIGFNLAFFPQFVAGTQGMPRRYATYAARFTNFHIQSTLGAYTMGVGMLMVFANFGASLLHGRRAPANPWGSNSLEWRSPSPPPHENFLATPVAGDPYDYSRWRWAGEDAGYVAVEPVDVDHSVLNQPSLAPDAAEVEAARGESSGNDAGAGEDQLTPRDPGETGQA